MGTKSKPRPHAQTPQVPSESFSSHADTAGESAPCPDKFSAPLAEYATGEAVDGVTVKVHNEAGDLVVADENGKHIGRLTGVTSHWWRCLHAEPYVGVVVKEDGDGPRVQLERVADH